MPYDMTAPAGGRRFRIAMTTSMIYGNKEGGLQRYVDSILFHMPLPANAEVCVFAPDCHSAFSCFGRPGIRRLKVSAFWNHPVRNILWHLFVYPIRLRLIEADLLWMPELRRQTPLHGGRMLTTIHDMARYKVPGKYDGWRMFFHMRIVPLMLRRNRRFITVSENTAKDVHEHLGIPRSKITPIPNGIDPALFHTRTDDRAPHDLPRPYFLYVARFEHPGKNHVRLIEAFERFSARRPGHALVLVGSVWSKGEVVVEAIKASKAKVIHLGFVTDAELRGLYRDTLALVFPSLYEGFGLPVLEAMACGAPVAAADRSSLPEVCGDAGLMFDPEDVASIDAAMDRLASDEALRAELKRKGTERVLEFSWRAAAEHYMKVFLAEAGR
jgi:glycosyltransferase involved in cell wall biosynthesis